MPQHLLRTLCVGCSKAVTTNAAAWQKLVAPFVIPRPQIIYQPRGCRECRNTGYAERQGIYEIITPCRREYSHAGYHLYRESDARYTAAHHIIT